MGLVGVLKNLLTRRSRQLRNRGFDRRSEPALGIVAMQMWLTLPMFFVFGMTCVVMGFFALLKQKLYIDSKTNKATEVSLPIVGKMKTNYPALVFVLVGFAAMYPIYSFKQPDADAKDDYLIKGRIEVIPPSTTGESRGGAGAPDFSTSIIMAFPSDVSDNQATATAHSR
jgi:hypothetical protein